MTATTFETTNSAIEWVNVPLDRLNEKPLHTPILIKLWWIYACSFFFFLIFSFSGCKIAFWLLEFVSFFFLNIWYIVLWVSLTFKVLLFIGMNGRFAFGGLFCSSSSEKISLLDNILLESSFFFSKCVFCNISHKMIWGPTFDAGVFTMWAHYIQN